MEVKIITGDINKVISDALLVYVFQELEPLPEPTAKVDRALGGEISALIKDKEIKGKDNELTVVHCQSRMPFKRVIVVGLGRKSEFKHSKLMSAMGEACRLAQRLNCINIACVPFAVSENLVSPELCGRALLQGGELGQYKFTRHRKKEENSDNIAEMTIVTENEEYREALQQGSKIGSVIASAVAYARDMANEPANFMTPSDLASEAAKTAKQYGMECDVLEHSDVMKLGMGAFLGVAAGSQQPPKFIILRYRGNKTTEKTVGYIGKGITFDSGGISLKPAEDMGEMKGDMAGGAAVISSLKAIAQLELKVNITGIIAATENLPSGSALKPGDIVKAMNDRTIEIISTDAEGRLTLADALSYANKINLSPIIDIATLTGACRIALGDITSGLFSNNQQFADKVLKAGEQAGEKLWQMPMFADYKEQNKSDIADIKNTGGRYAGAITAALFLNEFAGDTPWVHLDIAGTDRANKDRGYLIKGATGVSVATLINLAMILSAE